MDDPSTEIQDPVAVGLLCFSITQTTFISVYSQRRLSRHLSVLLAILIPTSHLTLTSLQTISIKESSQNYKQLIWPPPYM